MARQNDQLESVTGVQLARGIAVPEAKGFWAEAWGQVLRRPSALAAMVWLGVIGFFAVFAPVIASGHPLVMRATDRATGAVETTFPLLEHLRTSDRLLLMGVPLGLLWVLLPVGGTARIAKLGACIYGGALSILMVVAGGIVHIQTGQRDPSPFFRQVRDSSLSHITAPAVIAVAVGVVGLLLPVISPFRRRVLVVAATMAFGGLALGFSWNRPALQVYDYLQRERAGEITATYTVVPFSPNQRFTELDRRPPMSTLGDSLGYEPGTPGAARRFLLGTDALGQDVLSQLLAAARLAISIGLVSTGIAVTIGVTMGSVMGYFGGKVDLLLYRVVEIFQAIPVLFLLIITAAVTPPELRSTYTMMAIIGCFTWTTSARFIRAEFMKLRSQDFVQSAKAVGLPLRSVLFKHMLPNGVTPVLVDASFVIAAAITIEATLSFLGLGPVDQPSWGKLLSNATNSEGAFKWWLAIFPGGTIFLTVLSYNLIGEALRDAIDPKLKKARV
jgi:peptide/nickel transport system permease protein